MAHKLIYATGRYVVRRSRLLKWLKFARRNLLLGAVLLAGVTAIMSAILYFTVVVKGFDKPWE
jgi:hypothetical protein